LKKTFIEVVLIDDSLKYSGVLINGAKKDVSVLCASSFCNLHDEIEKLFNTPEISKLHFLGHGSPGWIAFNGYVLNLENLMNMNLTLYKNRSVYLWACNTGKDMDGEIFLQTLANRTGAVVYASSNLVGNHVFGGSWELNLVVHPE
jgi:hypothetical protein